MTQKTSQFSEFGCELKKLVNEIGIGRCKLLAKESLWKRLSGREISGQERLIPLSCCNSKEVIKHSTPSIVALVARLVTEL